LTDEASYMMFRENDKAGVQLLKCSNPKAIKQTSIVLHFILSENYNPKTVELIVVLQNLNLSNGPRSANGRSRNLEQFRVHVNHNLEQTL